MTSVPSWFRVLMTLRKATSGSRPSPTARSGYISILTPHSDIRITRSQGEWPEAARSWRRGRGVGGRGAARRARWARWARRGSGQRFGGRTGGGGQRVGDRVDGRVIVRRGEEPGLVA